MTAAPNPRAWAVATALAAESGLDWARWAAGRDGWCGRRSCSSDLDGQCACASPPVHAPWDADAYRADCARRGVEPGPMPSLSWTGDDGFGWRVCSSGVSFHDGDPVGEAVAWFNGTSVRFYADSIEHTLGTLARIVTLATAAKRAMGGP